MRRPTYIPCPACGRRYRISNEDTEKAFKCPGCGALFTPSSGLHCRPVSEAQVQAEYACLTRGESTLHTVLLLTATIWVLGACASLATGSLPAAVLCVIGLCLNGILSAIIRTRGTLRYLLDPARLPKAQPVDTSTVPYAERSESIPSPEIDSPS